MKYKRILLKLSGEAFLDRRDDEKVNIDPQHSFNVAKEIAEVKALGVEIGIVVGGGNIFRGAKAAQNGLHRTTADYIGMLATVMNSLALQDTLSSLHVDTRVQSAIDMPGIAEPIIIRRAIRHLEKGRIVIFAAGTGNPFVTTDSAGALRALEITSDVLLKATKVDGVYDKDPVTNPDAVKYDQLTYQQALDNPAITIMDKGALTMCAEHKMPIIAFDMMVAGNLKKVVSGEAVGTIIR